MLATHADQVPTGPGWRHEIKWDGMRVLAQVEGDRVRLFSRTERDVTVAFPELTASRAGLAGRDGLLVDGEIVSFADGRPSFSQLGGRFHVTNSEYASRLAAQAPVTLIAFDVLEVLGTSVIDRPWQERRDLLEAAELESPWVQVPPPFEDGGILLHATADQGLEGVVSKRIHSPYRPGVRSDDWRKIVHRRTDSFVVVGWRPEKDGKALGSILLGTPTPRGPVYRGKIGSGLAGAAGARLLLQLRGRTIDESPTVDEVPREDAAGCTWVRPDLVVDIEHLGMSPGGRLRQPSWRGIRGDLTAADLMETDVSGETDG